MEWHLRSGYPCYLAEASRKMRLYPPPQNNGYYTPWLWLDGRQRGSGYSSWAGYVAAQLSVPADIAIAITGSYNPGTREGEAVIEFTSSLAESLSATANVVLIEDSVYYSAPNGDPWHNHVCRDYLPNEFGTDISIPGGGYDTVIQTFTLQPAWVEQRCKVVVYAQDPTIHPDVGYGGLQAGQAPVLELTGLEEPRVPERFYQNVAAEVTPNPCRDKAVFRFVAPAGQGYKLGVYGLDGSLVREFEGVSRSGETSVDWLRDGSVARGVYGWRLACGTAVSTGKLVVTD